jgi:hypothetical protein
MLEVNDITETYAQRRVAGVLNSGEVEAVFVEVEFGEINHSHDSSS